MIAVLISVIVGAGLICILMAFSSIKKNKSTTTKKKKSKNNPNIIRDCSKKLAKDPRNIEALKELADVYYSDSKFEKAFPLYQMLFNLMGVHVELDQQIIASRYGICAYKMEKLDESISGFSKILRMNPKDFDGNFYLGKILLEKKDYEKSILCLKRANSIKSDLTEVCELLGYALYESKKYRECINYLKKVLDENPDNKKALFYFANSLEESSMGEKALKLFMHLRTDPTFGAESCIECGKLHEKQGQYEKSIQDYEIALKLESINPESKLSVFYKIAQTYLAMHNISKAIYYWKQIQSSSQNYKDVNALVARYQELNQNNNLQAYLMSGTSDFVVLCRKIVSGFYPDSFVKIEAVNVATESIEVLCTVESSKWIDSELFRFFRNTGSIGELYIRDCHSKMRDIKCDRGFCVTAGTFTEEAKKYVEGRPIDLIEKTKLIQVLKKVDMIN